MNDLGKQILSGITSAGKTAISGVTKAGNSAVHGVEKAGEKAYKTNADALQLVSKQFEDEVVAAGRNSLKAVKGAVADIEGDIKKELVAEAKKVVRYVERKALGELVDILKLTEDLLPDDVGVQVGPLGFSVNPKQDVDAIQFYANNPPDSVDDYIGMVQDFAPASVSVDLSIQVDALVVGTEAVDVTLTWNVQDDLPVFIAHLRKLWGDVTATEDVAEDPSGADEAELGIND